MLPEIAHFSLIIALCFSLLLVVIPLYGSFTDRVALMQSARPFAIAVCFFTTIATALLINSFLQDDFSLKVVQQHSNLTLPTMFKFSALWGGHEGSLLLWVNILALWILAVACLSRDVPLDMIARVLSVMGMIFVGFALFSLMTSNPFERLLPNTPLDGGDLNPLLQDFGMIIHPPLLYFGYVGFSVAFAFAIAGLISGEFDAAWVRWIRPWTTAAWAFLTIGIALGSWWAYYELGWGGWWFWDPVENASFMPWLSGTALIHSLAVTEKRGLFKSWTILLAIFTFSLSLLGTFLVRSGVLTSVHSFAADPGRGLFILGFLAIVIGGSLLLFAFRAPAVKNTGSFTFFSREMFLLLNNIILMVACLTVLVGTLFPLFADFFSWGKYSVGPPYFNKLFVPLMMLLIFILAPGSSLNWKKTSGKQVLNNLKMLSVFASVLALFFILVYQRGFQPAVVCGFLLAAWVLAAVIFEFMQKLRNAKGFWPGLKRLPLSFYGMQIAHIGLATTALGVAVVSQLNVERDIKMQVDESVNVAGYDFKFHGSEDVLGPNFRAQQGHITVSHDGDFVAELAPQKRFYFSQMGNVMTEAAIDDSLGRDLFVALGEPLAEGAWSVRIQYKPFIRLIWLGALLMTLGGILAASDKRYRK